MLKKYIIFDLDGTLINSIERNRDKIVKIIGEVDEKKINTAKYILSTTS
jgi:hydroxymethylpyrimidine pyrophosphatase-like HAD family hydrolase